MTFVLIRETEHPVRQFHLKTWQAQAMIIGAGLLILVCVGLGIFGTFQVLSALDHRALSEENQRLQHDLLFVEGRVGELEGSLRDLEEQQRWSRNQANLEPLGQAAITAGVGGPASERLSSEAAGMDRHLDRLFGRSQVLRQSAEEVMQAMRDDQDALSRIPSIRPILGGRISSRFGRRVDPFTGRPSLHHGLDLSARRGTPIMATANGRVTKTERSSGGFGNYLVIDHGNGFATRYAHCDRLLARKGQMVTRGEVIATVGSTGHSTAPHVHYEVIKDNQALNPSHYILSSEFIVD